MLDQHVYNQIVAHARDIRTLETILELLNWDQETLLPPAGHGARAKQQALLAGVIHEKKHDAAYFQRLEQLLPQATDQSDQSIIIKRLHRDISLAKKLPTSFVQEFSATTSAAFAAWQQARHQNSWKLFEPHMTTIVSLVRKKAELLGYSDHPLDPLLDLNEPGATTRQIATLFSSLKHKLKALLDEVKKTERYGQPQKSFPSTLEDQMALSRKAASLIGFDWNSGRLDTSEHPFSVGLHPTDSRMTIRHTSDDLFDQVLSALHESGHSLYEMGLNQNLFGTPLAEAASLSIHESQSRLWETVIGQSKAFATPLFSILRSHYRVPPVSSETALYNALNRVECSEIRTQADELTYPFHVILRFEIEQELLDGRLAVSDLPRRWNEGMHEMLGIIPRDDVHGCLQDVHWSFGSLGYFPTYTLGSWYAVCFFEAMKQALPHVEELIRTGTFTPIRGWLQENVWSQGRRFHSRELVARALGREPSEDDYIQYLQHKYLTE
jgi:carboxypeptidase Taq